MVRQRASLSLWALRLALPWESPPAMVAELPWAEQAADSRPEPAASFPSPRAG